MEFIEEVGRSNEEPFGREKCRMQKQTEPKNLRKELAKVKLERNIVEKCAGCLKSDKQKMFLFEM